MRPAAATVAPFRALRFRTDRVGDPGAVWAPPYDVIRPEAAAELRQRHPNNIVRLTNPGGEAPDRYAEAARILEAWIAEGVLVRDTEPAFYVHRHSFRLGDEARARIGVWGLLRLTTFGAGAVLPHERTMSGPKADRLALIRACSAQLSPVFFICSDADARVSELLRGLTSGEPVERAEFPAGEAHEIWRIDDRERTRQLAGLLAEQVFLIADGHHRYETALSYRDELLAGGAPGTGGRSHEFVLAHIVPESDPGLLLLPTHRVVGGGGLDWMAVVCGAADRFEVVRLGEEDLGSVESTLRAEAGRPSFVLVARGVEGGWLLRLRDVNSLSAIPTVAFHEAFMSGVAGLSPDEQIGRVSFVKDAGEALSRVRSGSAEAAALLAAPQVSQVRRVALAGERMPPKTTYFWPKVPTGVAIHRIDPAEDVLRPLPQE